MTSGTGNPLPLHPRAHEAVRVWPDLTFDGLVHRNHKAILLSGRLDTSPVIVKILVSDEHFWWEKFRREVFAYTAFTSYNIPFTVPRLRRADINLGLLVVDYLPGSPVSDDRYPGPISLSTIEAIILEARRFGGWSPPKQIALQEHDYCARFERYNNFGILTADDVENLKRTLARAGARREFNHGDALPRNILITPDGPAFIDWEFTGMYLPGYDLALLWLLLARTPSARERVQDEVGAETLAMSAFWLNLVLIIAREIWQYQEFSDDMLKRDQVPDLQSELKQALERMRRCASVDR
jgi:hypothetical protein